MNFSFREQPSGEGLRDLRALTEQRCDAGIVSVTAGDAADAADRHTSSVALLACATILPKSKSPPDATGRHADTDHRHRSEEKHAGADMQATGRFCREGQLRTMAYNTCEKCSHVDLYTRGTCRICGTHREQLHIERSAPGGILQPGRKAPGPVAR